MTFLCFVVFLIKIYKIILEKMCLLIGRHMINIHTHHILPVFFTGTSHVDPYYPPQLICCQSCDVTCHLVLVVSVQLLLPSGIVSQLTSVLLKLSTYGYGPEPVSVEDVVDVWRYAVLSCMLETKTTIVLLLLASL